MVKIAVVGAGAWGRNLVRNYATVPGGGLYACCDTDPKQREKLARQYPGAKVTGNLDEVLSDPAVDGVVIAAPAVAHYELAKKSLLAGKHTYVEKPLTLRVEHAEELVELSHKQGRILMVGHLLEYHPAVLYLKKLIDSGELGKVYYLYSQRVNLGKIRSDENALWSFAPHDISIILMLLGKAPTRVLASGQAYLQKKIEDVVFLIMHFDDGVMAQIQVSWLDPHKIRRTTVVGSRKMVVFDDQEATDKIKIYDRGVKEAGEVVSYGLQVRFGDIHVPWMDMTEPLAIECKQFVDSIREGVPPRTDGEDGLRVVRVLDAAQRSLDSGGASVEL